MKITSHLMGIAIILGLVSNVSCTVDTNEKADVTDADSAEIAIGERLFLETRFAQAYYANPGQEDPALRFTPTMDQPLRGPFAGKTMNCRACHMVDEHLEETGMRTYADFTHNSLVPDRKDGNHLTPRNSMSLVNISVASKHGILFHFDGQFNSMEDLVRATLSGRNYGWLADESEQAIKHIANIIRSDEGNNDLGKEFGGSYQRVLTGSAKDIPAEFRLPEEYRLDVAKASDQQIFDAVANLITAYVNDLNFATDENGNYIGSPYDAFLALNDLPQQAIKDESPKNYAQRLLTAVNKLESPKFVTAKDGEFKYHKQAFTFGDQELKGLKLFLTPGNKGDSNHNVRGGNCVSCHAAPHFSDFSFHNTGLSQIRYDELHGTGEFAKLKIPDLKTRSENYNQYLPATAKHPKATGPFRSLVNLDKPGYVDLGLWNVFANPDMPAPQAKLSKILCEQAANKTCSASNLLPMTLAAFKTPVLRDLGHSNPYMHAGQFNTLNETVAFYVTSSALAKQGQLRNADPALHSINITGDDVLPLVAFLKALNEDYD